MLVNKFIHYARCDTNSFSHGAFIIGGLFTNLRLKRQIQWIIYQLVGKVKSANSKTDGNGYPRVNKAVLKRRHTIFRGEVHLK